MMLNMNDCFADVRRALLEDVGSGDVTSQLLPDDVLVEAEIISREPMLLCGQPWVDATFLQMSADIKVNWLVREGTWLNAPTILCKISGLARAILSAERTAINFLQTLSGTATTTSQYVRALQGYKSKLLDTRKTLPGLRMAQKYAVFCAGGINHRFGLYDAYLIKENHIRACGSIQLAIERAKQENTGLLIEIEVESLDELQQALRAVPDRIMLDNFTIGMMLEAVQINKTYNCALEVSGGVSLENIVQIAQTGVDYISVGQLTKSVRAIDLSLLIRTS